MSFIDQLNLIFDDVIIEMEETDQLEQRPEVDRGDNQMTGATLRCAAAG